MTALVFGSRPVDTGRALVMTSVDLARPGTGVGPGVFAAAMAEVDRVVAEGADIVEIGAPVQPGQDNRLESLLRDIRQRHPDLVLGIDTALSEVARLACAAGVDLLCARYGRGEVRLAELAAEYQTGIVCADDRPPGRDADLIAMAETMVALGVPASGVVIEPSHDLLGGTAPDGDSARGLADLVATGWPVLIRLPGPTAVDPTAVDPTAAADPDELADRALAVTAVAAWSGVRVFRTCDVRRARQVVDMVASIAGTRPPSYVLRALA